MPNHCSEVVASRLGESRVMLESNQKLTTAMSTIAATAAIREIGGLRLLRAHTEAWSNGFGDVTGLRPRVEQRARC